MDKESKKRGKRSQVGPLDGHEGNTSFELDIASDKTPQHHHNSVEAPEMFKVLDTFRDHVKETSRKRNAIVAIVDAKKSLSKWRSYATSKRVRERKNHFLGPTFSGGVGSGEEENEERHSGGIGLDDIEDQFVKNDDVVSSVFGIQKNGAKRMSTASNRSLIDYFAKLGRSTNPAEVIDLDFVETLLKSGAQINCTDKHGQSLLHEVARTWHVDVAKFLLEQKADVNLADKYGRTPLHVAAAVDYPAMVNLLLENDADINAKTKVENQTPIHFAAKNDACESLKMLINHNANFDTDLDFKGRTPLHLAAELDRSESARLLLDRKARVGNADLKGNKILSWMINKMPPVAYDALSQYHSTDRPNRKQYLYLHLLVQDRVIDPNGETQIPLQVAVNYKQFDLLMHLVFSRLINIMWVRFARWRAYLQFFLNFVYILLWSVLGVMVEYNERHHYILPDHWWRIVLLVACIAFTIYQVVEEINEYRQSVRRHKAWENRRMKDIEQDLQFCHPRWPEEELFLRSELKDLDKMSPKYFKDYWNVFDWVCYGFLFFVIITHIVDIIHHSEDLARLHISVMAITIILLWVRLAKSARPFSLIGPFIVILSHMLNDLLRFAFLYLEFFLPYVCAFWMIFGGTRVAYEDRHDPNANATITVSGFEDFNAVLFTMFRLTLVDEYQYDDLKLIDPIMTDILVGTWLALSAIICLNLFIALLSDTFQRVYDNAQANAIMQKAITCLGFWDGMSSKARNQFLDYIAKECSPLQEYYDDDMTEEGEEDMKKVTIQIKEDLDEFREMFAQKFLSGSSESNSDSKEDQEGLVTTKALQNEVTSLQISLAELKDSQKKMQQKVTKDMNIIKTLLLQMAGGGGGNLAGMEGLLEITDEDTATLSTDTRKHKEKSGDKKKKKKKHHSDYSLLESETPIPPVSDERHVDVSYPDFSAGIVPQVTTTSKGTSQDPTSDC
ncbi:transient receptor potential cation channel subfamily V member 3-like [Ylistrum balloti]|uniref:transient receptor potential cation channel subfamily V member 3-like n=1 Tax=Ylistrum balloti TaxID=509963 RepID=UPI0029058024|nr:transient receptor potential cation channel subfamily V member 3-like [Ylistrum balloti]